MSTSDDTNPEALDAFIERWREAQAAEIANAQTFVIELCELLGVPRPDPATKDPARDGYVFERPVAFQDGASASGGRIDLYKRSCFVLETKQGVDAENAARAVGKGKSRSAGHGTRGTAAWDRTMAAAKRQAERYARNLDVPAAHGAAALSGRVNSTVRLAQVAGEASWALETHLGRIYRDPGAVRARVLQAAEQVGPSQAVKQLAESPETFGKLTQ